MIMTFDPITNMGWYNIQYRVCLLSSELPHLCTARLIQTHKHECCAILSRAKATPCKLQNGDFHI